MNDRIREEQIEEGRRREAFGVLEDTSTEGGFVAWDGAIRQMVNEAMNPTFQQTVDAVMGEVRDLIVARQRTYGPSNIQQQGIFGIINRIGNDKLARIRQRLHGRIENGEIVLDPIELGSVDEPGIINDLADVIGYAVCGILLLRGEWGMPLAEGDE